jgi:hypothetical protein
MQRIIGIIKMTGGNHWNSAKPPIAYNVRRFGDSVNNPGTPVNLTVFPVEDEEPN